MTRTALESLLVGDNLQQICERHAEFSPSLVRRTERIAQIIRYYRWSQIARRVLSRITAASRVPSHRAESRDVPVMRRRAASIQGISEINRILLATWRHARRTPFTKLDEGQIELVGQVITVGVPVRWREAGERAPNQLWRFQLHYHEFLLDWLTAVQFTDAAEFARTGTISRHPRFPQLVTAIDEWIRCFPDADRRSIESAWHPYCISRRLPVWLCLIDDSLDETIAHRWLSSLWLQAQHLSNHLEHDPGGNHLLENLTTLALIAAELESPAVARWTDLVEVHLARELRRQILPWGEHIERTPMYHAHILRNLLRVTISCENVFPRLAGMCRAHSKRMADFLSSILHVDGEIPLLADSGFEDGPSVQQIRKLCAAADIDFPESPTRDTVRGGYWTFRNSSSTIIFDGGNIGCDWLPAHAHCDLLGFEISSHGRRWMVDSGNFNYQDDTMRSYCRSTLAHNTLSIGGKNQCDVWSKFRMGSRGKVKAFLHGTQGDFAWATASHDAYRRMGTKRVTRVISASSADVWFCADWCDSPPQAPLLAAIHFSNDVTVDPLDDRSFSIQLAGFVRKLHLFGTDYCRIVSGWYCRALGRRQEAPVLLYGQQAREHLPLGWICYPVESGGFSVEVESQRISVHTSTDDSEQPIASPIFVWTAT